MSEEKKTAPPLFAVFARIEGHDQPLIQTDLKFSRLLKSIVVPNRKKDPFFIDGFPVTAQALKQIKIVKQGEFFRSAMRDLHFGMSMGSNETKKIYGEQYYLRLDSIVRRYSEDVTTEVLQAFDRALLKKSINVRDFLPNRKEIIQLAIAFFKEAMK